MRNLILGPNALIASNISYKRALLTGQLCVVAKILCLVYIILGLTLQFKTTWLPLTACFLLTVATFFINRAGHHTTAKIMLATATNITVFCLCIIEPFETGLYSEFVPCGLGAIAMFGYEDRAKATFFVCLSAVLFLASIVAGFDLINEAAYTHEYIRTNIVVNFLACFTASLLIIYFLVDVNHHSEAILRQNEIQIHEKNVALTKVNTELDRFVYSTSHDLRAPISSIQGLIQLAGMTNETAEIRKYIQIMDGRLVNLNKFIDDISDYARNARTDVNLKLVDVRSVIESILDSLSFYPGSDKVKIILDIPTDLQILTDPTRLQIVLSNLISNAFKYADGFKAESRVDIKIKSVEGGTTFIIADNGIGIREEFHGRIFDMFFQGTDRANGSGLGLYIVRETLEKLNGKISFKSSFGEGTTFTVILPD